MKCAPFHAGATCASDVWRNGGSTSLRNPPDGLLAGSVGFGLSMDAIGGEVRRLVGSRRAGLLYTGGFQAVFFVPGEHVPTRMAPASTGSVRAWPDPDECCERGLEHESE